MGKAKPFSAENDKWIIKNHCPDVIVKDFTITYNLWFGENRSVDTMKHHIKRLGLKQERRNFTEEEDTWLKENAPLLSVEETARKFNDTFGTHRSAQVLKVRCNRSLRVFHANKKYGFGYPIGSETVLNSYTWVKISDVPYRKNSFYKNWKQKSRIVWEEHNGDLPDGHTVVFLDRNHGNCNIKNLYAVNGQVLREMSKKSWWSENREITLTAIKWCELFYTIKGSE